MPATFSEMLEMVRDDIASKEAEIEKLRTVQEYLEGKLGFTLPPSRPPKSPQEAARRAIHAFSGLTKHDACERALKNAGKPMKTAEIAKILRDAKYGEEMDEHVFQNSLFTSMTRKTDTFRKIGPGTWGLVEWGDSITTEEE